MSPTSDNTAHTNIRLRGASPGKHTPLTVDVNCVCNPPIRPNSTIGLPASTPVQRLHPYSSLQVSHPITGPASDQPICRVPGHDKHHRSISASPHYYYAGPNAAQQQHGKRVMTPAALNVPLLIPLNSGGGINWSRGGSARMLIPCLVCESIRSVDNFLNLKKWNSNFSQIIKKIYSNILESKKFNKNKKLA